MEYSEKIGFVAGYLFAYAIFTSMLFLILNLTHKIPQTWNFLHIMTITLFVGLLGVFLNKIL